MVRKAQGSSVFTIVSIVFMIVLFFVLFYVTRVYFKSSNYEIVNEMIVSSNMNNFLYGMNIATIPGLNYTYVELLLLSAKQKDENPNIRGAKIYIGNGARYILLDDLLYNVFDSYFNKGHWHIDVYIDNKKYSYGYSVPFVGRVFSKSVEFNSTGLESQTGKYYNDIVVVLKVW